MNLRTYIQKLAERGELLTITEPISTQYEVAAVMKQLEPRPVLFENVADSQFRVVGNLFASKGQFADYFGIQTDGIIPLLTGAIEAGVPTSAFTPSTFNPSPPCQEVIHLEPDLDALPILRHFPADGGNYLTSGVAIAAHPEYGQNMDFHRGMQISPREMALRVVRGRHFHRYLEDLGEMDVAICVGNTPDILAAAATSVALGVDELSIAEAIAKSAGAAPPAVTRAKTVDLMIPADAEFVIEGTIYRDRRHAEGPFVDLTETQDVIRDEPVLVVRAITHRRDAIWQALLPGALEHKLLMGMPREPTIFRTVNAVARCLDVNVNPGGCSWLHAIVQIDKRHEDDGRRAILAAFEGHRSCKHVFVVDADVDIYDPLQVEWALATRFQGDRDLVMLDREPGSSLDPSAEPETKLTAKIGFDLTAPLGDSRRPYERISYPHVDLERFSAL